LSLFLSHWVSPPQETFGGVGVAAPLLPPLFCIVEEVATVVIAVAAGLCCRAAAVSIASPPLPGSSPRPFAALINDSIGVICTNTAALQLANAHEKRSIALFSSEEKGRLFVPNAEEKRCVIISSKPGKLADIDVDVVKTAMQQEFAGSLVLA
ncbi:hypothetical protein Taro_033564, partial [Colocasia esculenta]|nr:hypothetical protein [Colocasia esculenta]